MVICGAYPWSSNLPGARTVTIVSTLDPPVRTFQPCYVWLPYIRSAEHVILCCLSGLQVNNWNKWSIRIRHHFVQRKLQVVRNYQSPDLRQTWAILVCSTSEPSCMQMLFEKKHGLALRRCVNCEILMDNELFWSVLCRGSTGCLGCKWKYFTELQLTASLCNIWPIQIILI